MNVIESHLFETSDTFNELARIVLTFGLIGMGLWVVIKLMVRSGKKDRDKRRAGVNRQQRRATRAKMRRKQRRH